MYTGRIAKMNNAKLRLFRCLLLYNYIIVLQFSHVIMLMTLYRGCVNVINQNVNAVTV